MEVFLGIMRDNWKIVVGIAGIILLVLFGQKPDSNYTPTSPRSDSTTAPLWQLMVRPPSGDPVKVEMFASQASCESGRTMRITEAVREKRPLYDFVCEQEGPWSLTQTVRVWLSKIFNRESTE